MTSLEAWFENGQRDFPWRKHRTPYRVWISEVMLQQTRASVVVPYFEKWLEVFPTVVDLYRAPLEQVIKAWEGLGYYSRARNLHKAAGQMVERFGGEIPSSRKDLEELAGFGPYTVGAVLSFGFHQKAIAIDGNVIRVLSRYFCIEENVARSSVRRQLEEKGLSLLHPKTPWVSAEALIELGATVCLPKPKCDLCPLQNDCLALKSGKTLALPIQNAKPATIFLEREVFVIECDGCVLVKKTQQGQVMADLYEFPYVEKGQANPFAGPLIFVEPVQIQTHSFTKYKVTLWPRQFRSAHKFPTKAYDWVPISTLDRLAFSSGHRKIAHEIRIKFLQF
jgi:A/G-specific adenine glycosylase